MAPPAVNTIDFPKHIDVVGTAETGGNGLTVTVVVVVLTHPLASVPVIV
jgi:hypothetical protein